MSYIEKEKLIKADIASIENRVRHAFNQGYDLGFKDGKKRAKPQEQEPLKPMVEIDLYSVIKQKYIEREVLDKIRAEIRSYSIYVMPQYGRTIREADVLHIIDKYEAEGSKEA